MQDGAKFTGKKGNTQTVRDPSENWSHGCVILGCGSPGVQGNDTEIENPALCDAPSLAGITSTQ